MSDRLRLTRGASVAELHGEAVVLHLPSGKYFSANGTGAALLRRLSLPGGATRDGLAHALIDEYRVDATRAQADVAAWIERLTNAGLVEGVEGAPGAGGDDRQ